MQLSKLTEGIKIGMKIDGGRTDLEIDALETDSRKVTKNALFFCVSGESCDGHEHVEEAVKNGAVAIVCERPVAVDVPQIVVENVRKSIGKIASNFYGNANRQLKMVAILGTNGKTTTSYMLANILRQAKKKVGVIGTVGIVYGQKKFASPLTTPDPIELHKILSDMSLCGVEYVIIEVSAHALHYCKMEGISFSAVIFTNFTQDHLDFFKDMDVYKQAKLKLFNEYFVEAAVVNGDDCVGREIVSLCDKKKIKTLSYGLTTPTDVFAVITAENSLGTECILNINDELCNVSLEMIGRYNVYNALGAATCARVLGVSIEDVARGLNTFRGVEGRLEKVDVFNGGTIYVDFAHTPDGLENVLNALRGHCRGRLTCLFGCGGNRDKEKRPMMGEIVAKKTDFAILTSDNPRYEDPLDIITDIENGVRRISARYVIVPERRTAIEYALDTLQDGDVLLIAGKGGERYQEIMGIKYLFNDHDIIVELLEEKRKR